MKPMSFIVQPLRLIALLTLGACIKTDCVTAPCAMPLALMLTVSNAATGGTVPNAVFAAQGPTTGSGDCGGTPTTCAIAGSHGTYSVTVSAPGFQSATRTVTVAGTDGEECHCATVETGHLNVVLTAN